MGITAVSSLLEREQIKLSSLKNKKVAVDTYIELHQFLRTMPRLTNRAGEVTTHLSGLFYRTVHLLSLGIKPAFVLDGKFPEICRHEHIAVPTKPRTGLTITPEIVQSTRRLLELFGVPVIQGPSEGEAQAAYMARKGAMYAVASQDFDALLFGAPLMVYNLTMAKVKKTRRGLELIGTYVYDLKKNLKRLRINHDQFIALCILLGTDFNPGVEGIGPKRGLELVRRYRHRLDKLFRFVPWRYQYTWKEVYDCIKTMPVTNKYRLNWKKPDVEGLREFLVDEHNFSPQRMKKALEKLS